MASHLSWFVNLLFLLLILAQAPSIYTRPASAAPTAELIAGNEFLKLFFEHDESQRELHSGEYDESTRLLRDTDVRADHISSSTSKSTAREGRVTRANHHETAAITNTQSSGEGTSGRSAAARSLQNKSHNMSQNEATAPSAVTTMKATKVAAEETKQVVQLVTSGSKIIFLEDYDYNDAIVDAVARDIDLKKENAQTQDKQAAKENVRTHNKSNRSDEVKVVAVSVSSSSKRGGSTRANNNQYKSKADTVMSKQSNKFSASQTSMPQNDDIMRHKSIDNIPNDGRVVAMNMKLTLTTTPAPSTAPMTASATSNMDEFVNRSHKSEFSIEEAEPLTMSPQKQRATISKSAARANSPRSLHTPHAVSGRAVKMTTTTTSTTTTTTTNTNLDDGDSENSASTNIQNVLAAPLLQSTSMRTGTSNVPTAYHSVANKSRNVTSSRINHNHNHNIAATSHASSHIGAADVAKDDDMNDDAIMLDTSVVGTAAATTIDMEEKLLPFQTVIYHNTKEGHGPQSRSISYSSLSQNVEDLQRWSHRGILAEAQRNVSESLKPIPRAQLPHTSEPAKFYSMPSKMYSEPSKFYSEPAKMYGEPAKVYGEPEKFYSEPAKVYGQPAKFYSEPSKVYSQPAKVYSEPAKTYWSPSGGAATASTSTTTTTPTSITTTTKPPIQTTSSTTTTTVRASGFMPSRRPAIVSRIAFGEAQSSTGAPRVIDEHAPATMSVIANQQQQQQQQQHNTHHTRFQSHPHSHAHSTHTHSHSAPNSHAGSAHVHLQSHSTFVGQSQPTNTQTQSQPRRILFNLDKLPYDLLNAPIQSSQHLLDPDFSHSPPAAVTYSSPRQRQCLESAFSVSLSQAVLQQRQHSSLSDEHSNQNAKGLPNRDLVKCVSIYNQPQSATSTATTESGHNGSDGDDADDNNDDLYKPTPVQNYEIEESVSVVTNGRAHGVQSNSAATTTTTAKPYAMRTTKHPSRGGIQHQQQQQQQLQQHYHSNANTPNVNTDNNYDDNVANVEDSGGLDGGGGGGIGDDGEYIGSDGNKTGNDDEDAKVAYVVEGRNYRKYRVEEKTDDGFIVGEYGVVDHNDGNLRGVRYTADSTINRSLIQKALLTFLKLK